MSRARILADYVSSGDELAAVATTANAALPKAGGAMTGAITTNSTFDGIDIATRDGVLTSTTTTANAALPKAGGTIDSTGNGPLIVKSTYATGGYIEYKLGASGATIGYLGSGAGLVSGGAAADLSVRSQGNLVFSTGGNTERLRIDSSGYISYPAQPCFSANGFDTRTGHEIVTYVNVPITSSDFSNSTGRFTAPVDGRYWFGWQIGHKGFENHMGVGLMIDNSFFTIGWSDNMSGLDHDSISGSVLIDLNENQFASLGVHSSYPAPPTGNYTLFSGFLVSAE